MVMPGSGATSDTARKLTVSFNDGDHNESNDTLETATELTQNVNTYFNLHGSNDEDWFKITTTVPGDAIQLVFSNFNYTVDPIAVSLCSVSGGIRSYLYSTTVSTNDTVTYKVNTPGDYYVRIKPENKQEFVTRELKLRYELLAGDDNELNDSRETATTLVNNVNTPFTLNGGNDVDWFYFETTEPNQLMYLYITGFETDYSNKISYMVYDLVDGEAVLNSSDTASINVIGKGYNLSNVGGHYIQIKPDGWLNVENTLQLRIDLRQSQNDDCEPNDTWQEATPLVYGAGQAFTLPAYNDIDWFCFTVDDPDQTLALTFASVSSGGSINWQLYSAEALELSTNATALYTDTSSNGTYYWMLGDAGTYYVRTRAYNSSKTFSDAATIRYELIEPDENERNNTWKTATAITEEVNTAFTLPAYNDYDWFKFTVDEPNQTVKLTFSNVPSGGKLHWALYSGQDLTDKGDSASSLTTLYTTGSGSNTYYYMLGDAGTYYVKAYPYGLSNRFSDQATIRYELIRPDENERNDTWKTATAITEEVDTAFTLPAYNDYDWFKFTVDEPNQTVKLTFSNVPVSKLKWVLYSGQDLTDKGDAASALTSIYTMGSGSTTYYWMLGDAGTYYAKVFPYGEGYQFSESATIRYELIEPDSNEPNGDYATATSLTAGSAAWFTLPASNDYDWFALDELQVGDQIDLIVGSTTVTYPKVNANLYVLSEGSTGVSKDCTVGRHTDGYDYSLYRGTVTQAGTHYLSLNSNSGKLYGVSDGLYVKYTVTRGDAVAVTGIKLLTSAETLPEGKTLLLNTKLTPYYASNQSLTWSSSAPTVATVDNNGLVTALTPGETTVTVTTQDGGYSASCVITVVSAIRATGVTLDQVYTELQPKSLALDTSLQLRATLDPEDTTNRNVTWVSSDPKVLAVTNYGKVTAIGSGKASITVTTEDGGFSASTWFSVPDETYPVTRITLDKTSLSIYMNEDGARLTATVRPTYATNPSVTWSSDKESVATVDQNGVVTAVSEGYATITVTAAENPAITAECRVAVLPERIRVSGLSFEKTALDLGLYTEVTLTPIFAPDDATVKTLTWSSSNKNVATVSRTGKVSTLGLGYADITATSEDGGFTATIRINVSPSAEMGDVNNDGSIDAADALMILQASVDLRKLTTTETALADVSGDALVDAADAILILRYAAGLIDTFPKK